MANLVTTEPYITKRRRLTPAGRISRLVCNLSAETRREKLYAVIEDINGRNETIYQSSDIFRHRPFHWIKDLNHFLEVMLAKCARDAKEDWMDNEPMPELRTFYSTIEADKLTLKDVVVTKDKQSQVYSIVIRVIVKLPNNLPRISNVALTKQVRCSYMAKDIQSGLTDLS
jgi:hypothetical protein